jgi:4-hydroxy-tetrahydrodipicolinate synthase
MSLFTGLSAFPLTPADEAGRVDTGALQRSLDRIVDARPQSIGLLGSTGTFMYLSREERRRAVVAAVECVAGRVPLVVGIGALRTDEAWSLARDAAQAGADGLLLAPVSYIPLTQEEAYQHYAAVASATDLPLAIYNNPTATHFSFSDALLFRLAEIDTIKAVKMPLPKDRDVTAELDRLRAQTPPDFAIGYSGDWGCAEALLCGADCWYSVVGGLLPNAAAALTKAAMAGNGAQARRLNEGFEPLWQLFQAHGSLRVMYAMARILGLDAGEPPRPLLPLSPEATACVEAALARASALAEA